MSVEGKTTKCREEEEERKGGGREEEERRSRGRRRSMRRREDGCAICSSISSGQKFLLTKGSDLQGTNSSV